MNIGIIDKFRVDCRQTAARAVATAFLVLSALLLCTCSRNSNSGVPSANDTSLSAPTAYPVAEQPSSQGIITKTGDDVSDNPSTSPSFKSVYNALAAELERQLIAIASRPGFTRFESGAPQGENGLVTDLAFNGITRSLTWSYMNLGDYDLNGEVGVPDITHIANNFLAKTDDGIGNDDLESWIDGSGNGEVGIEDVTPIAQNYTNNVSSYIILISDEEDGEFTELMNVSLDAHSGGIPPVYDVLIPLNTMGFVAVQPKDASGDLGTRSCSLYVDTRPPDKPARIVEISPIDGVATALTEFSAVVSGNTPITYAWDFGDVGTPSTSTMMNPTVILGKPGLYTISLTATNPFGEDFLELSFKVWDEPRASLSVSPNEGEPPLLVTLNAEDCVCADDEVVLYEWDFLGDGNFSSLDNSPIVDFTYENSGTFTPSVLITDKFGAQSQASASVRVNTLPVAFFDADNIEGEPPFDVNFDASDSHDPDGVIVSFEWDFEGDGVYDANTGQNPEIHYTYEEVGDFEAVLRVIDDDGAYSTYGREITTTGWHAKIIDDDGYVGRNLYFADANGYPAVTYKESPSGAFKYIHALDPVGRSWSGPIELISGEKEASDVTFAAINGALMACYVDHSTESIWLIRANDSLGDSWDEPVEMFSGWSSEMLLLVDGNPAIILGSGYTRSYDDIGDSWREPVTWYQGWIDIRSAAVVGGLPAVTFYSEEFHQLLYAHAYDVNGETWSDGIKIDFGIGTGLYSSIAVVEGNPAIAYLDELYDRLKYVRALDPQGDLWPESIIVYEVSDAGAYASLAIYNDNPAIVYQDRSEGSLMLVAAEDPIGTSWGEPFVIDHGNVGKYASFRVIDGTPCMAYYDYGTYSLKYAAYY